MTAPAYAPPWQCFLSTEQEVEVRLVPRVCMAYSLGRPPYGAPLVMHSGEYRCGQLLHLKNYHGNGWTFYLACMKHGPMRWERTEVVEQ